MIEIISLKAEHLLELMEKELTEHTLDKDNIKANADLIHNSSLGGIAVRENNKILGVAGIIMFYKGVGEVWCIINKKDANRYKIKTFKTAIDFVVKSFINFNLQRLQAHCDVNIPYAIKFLEKLGFEREGIMRKYGEDGSDHYLYSIVR